MYNYARTVKSSLIKMVTLPTGSMVLTLWDWIAVCETRDCPVVIKKLKQIYKDEMSLEWIHGWIQSRGSSDTESTSAAVITVYTVSSGTWAN